MTVRITNGNSTAGRVEIFYNGLWGSVCDDLWDIQDATVLCRSLGFPSAVRATHNAEFGEGNGPIFLDDLTCSGTEDSILHCGRSRFNHNCDHSDDAGAVCSPKGKRGMFLFHRFRTLLYDVSRYIKYS